MRVRCQCLVLLGALAAGAQAPPERNDWLQLQGAYVGHGYAPELKPSHGLGLALGQWLSPHWGWEASLLRDPVQDRSGSWSSFEVGVHGSVLFDPLPNPGRLRPFLRLGAGAIGGVYEPGLAVTGTTPGLGLAPAQLATSNTPSATTRLSILAGAGLQAQLGASVLATLEARALAIEVSPSRERTEHQVLVGVGYRWGHSRPSQPLPEVPVIAPPPYTLPEPHPLPPPEEPSAPVPLPPRDPEISSQDLPRPISRPMPRKIVLNEAVLHFTNGGARLSPAGAQAVRDGASELTRYSGRYDLEVVGHTSRIGGHDYNLALSRRRAEAVARVLVESGIPASRIRTRGAGYDQPVASDRTEQGQARNRRVEILIRTHDPAVTTHRIHTPLAERDAPHAHRSRPHRRKVGS
jgi:outer membrane protein OmpA-like peptidoglycan-associated protein